jgi:hypothetical protein
VKNNNLKSWQRGTSGNPHGRPKGSRNIKKVIQELLNDPTLCSKLDTAMPRGTQTPLEAIIYTLMSKSIAGDVRASDVILKHAIDKDMPVNEGGFFSKGELKITIVDPQGQPIVNEADDISKLIDPTPVTD